MLENSKQNAMHGHTEWQVTILETGQNNIMYFMQKGTCCKYATYCPYILGRQKVDNPI